jgi:uncharacterized protein GlcG (DUF336 family)
MQSHFGLPLAILSWERRLMVTLGEARKVIAAAEQKAAEIKQPMNIAVVDEGGNLVSHARMDGAWIGSIDISINKAFTSRAFDISTKELAQYSQSGGQFFGIHVSNHGRVMIFAGGIPLKRAGKVVGAVGVSGGSGDRTRLWRKLARRHSNFLLEKTSYGKQSWSSVRRTRKSGGTANRFSEVIAGIAKVRARRNP